MTTANVSEIEIQNLIGKQLGNKAVADIYERINATRD